MRWHKCIAYPEIVTVGALLQVDIVGDFITAILRNNWPTAVWQEQYYK